MGSIRNLTGERFGRLVAIRCVGKNKYGKAMWLCECDCGNETIVISGELTRSDGKGTKSCGCLQKEAIVEYNKNAKKTHGMYGTRIHTVWKDMLYRCEKPSTTNYKNYGGRGITVCDEWHDLKKFAEWAYSTGYNETAARGDCTIERIDVNGNYEPANCKWVNMFEQNANRRITVKVEVDGKTMPLMIAVRNADVNYRVVYKKMRYCGFSFNEAVDCAKNRANQRK